MALSTKLKNIKHAVVLSRPVDAVSYGVNSEYIFHIARPIMEGIFHLIKSDSNNNPVLIKPSDSVFMQKKIVQSEQEVALARAYPNKGVGQFEKEWKLLSASPQEIMKMINLKCYRVAIEWNRFIEFLTNTNSAKIQGHVDSVELDMIQAELSVLKKITLDLIGSGELKAGKFDTGKEMVASNKTGGFIPDLDLNIVKIVEASPDASEAGALIEEMEGGEVK